MDFRRAPRRVIRDAQRVIRAKNRTYGPQMTPVGRDEWPDEFDRGGVPVIGCWRSRSCLAVAYAERPPAVRLTIQRTTLLDDGQWLDGITWEDLQRVKNECGFAALDAVEIYPAAGDVVNVANLRHLWILPEPFYLTWR